MSITRVLLGLLGLGAGLYLYQTIGWGEIVAPLTHIGFEAGYIFLPFFLTNYVNTWAWVSTFPPPFSKYRLSFSRLYWLRICGESVNNFMPTAHIGGDVTRVLYLKKMDVPATTGLVTVIMDKAALVITEILFIFTGIFLLLMEAGWSSTLTVWAAPALLIAGIIIYLLLAALHKGLLSRCIGFLDRKLAWPAVGRLLEKVRHLDNHLAQFYHNHHSEFLRSNGLHYLGWVMGAAETWVMMYLLGHPIGILDAVMIEALIALVKGLGFFIPGSLGVLEGGSILLFQTLDFGQGLGLTFSLLKRAREIVIAMIGWLFLSTAFPKEKSSAS